MSFFLSGPRSSSSFLMKAVLRFEGGEGMKGSEAFPLRLGMNDKWGCWRARLLRGPPCCWREEGGGCGGSRRDEEMRMTSLEG